jgi:hypothetical protein
MWGLSKHLGLYRYRGEQILMNRPRTVKIEHKIMFTGGLNQVWIFGLLKQVETGVDGRVRFLYVNFVNN